MKKQLLKESEIRKMMKFADIGALSAGFVDRLNEQADVLPDEEEGEDLGMDMASAEGPGEEMPPAPEGEEGLEGLEGEEGAGDEVLAAVGDAVEALKRALSAAGPEGQAAADAISVEGAGTEGDLEGEEEFAGLEGEEELGADMDLAGGEEALAGPEEEGEMVAEVEVVDDEELEEEMVNEVARRVARRITLLRNRREML